jgi:hypothetical protein
LIQYFLSKNNLLQIKDRTELLNRKLSSNSDGFRLSIDWIHNLVYYNENHKIVVFNMTDTRYEIVVIEKVKKYILDLSVNPLDSIIFYSSWKKNKNKGIIMKASQDGSNRTKLRGDNIVSPSALTIDLVSRRVIWFDYYFNTFSSIDFEGNNFLTFRKHMDSTYYAFIVMFDDYIYWTHYREKFIFKTKLELNYTQLDYLITSENNTFGSFKLIDSSLQPNSTNRCINTNCSHLCLPISINQYRCVCPKLSIQNENKPCRESVCI